MKHFLPLACLAAALGTGLSGAAWSMHHEGLEAKFKAADKDNDGTLDKEEAKALPRVAKQFARIDTDKDGTVTLQEIGAAMKQGMHGKGKARFDAADKDKDGTLDKDEAKSLKHVAEHFDAIDADKDGTVSLDEVHAFMKEHHHGK